ncbi:EamA family transporter [soil metagenome]
MSSGRATLGGLLLALVSAATFGTSGSFAGALLDAGWSPGAAVTTRIGLAAVFLTVPALIQLRGRWILLRRNLGLVVIFGLAAVAAAQLFFFLSVERVPVGVAILLEYSGVLLVGGWLWWRGQRPGPLTLSGAVVAMVGLVLVLDLLGAVSLDPIGVLWGLLAAVGLATYFVISGRADSELPPLVLAWGGMLVATVALLVAGTAGVLPLRAATGDVELAGEQVSWLVPVLGLSVVAAAIAYVTGVAAVRLLGSRVASFVGLTEVLFAVLFAWLLLSQTPTAVQAVGGLLVLAGVALVRADDHLAVVPEPVAAASARPRE